MMDKELYINGILADIDENTSISLDYTSFLFQGISDITDNKSWTVELPDTYTNRTIIEDAITSDSDSDIPYILGVVNYYVGGFKVISNGIARLTEGDGNISMLFNFGTAYEKIKSLDDVQLTEIDEATGNALNDFTVDESTCGDWLNWNRAIIMSNMARGCNYAEFYGYSSDKEYTTATYPDMPFRTMHPVITFNKILSLIERHFDIDLSDLKKYSEFDEYSTVLKGEETSETLCKYVFPGFYNLNGTAFNGSAHLVNVLQTPIFGPYTSYDDGTVISGSLSDIKSYYYDFPALQGGGSYEYFEIHSNKNITDAKLKATFQFTSKSKIEVSVLSGFADVNQTIVLSAEDIPYTDNGDSTYTYNTSIEIDMDLSESSKFALTFKNVLSFGQVSNYQWWTGNAPLLSFDIISNTAFFGLSDTEKGFYPIIPNLPDMSCADFIYQCMQLKGLFPYLKDGEPDKLYFRSCKSFYNNISEDENLTIETLSNESILSISDMLPHSVSSQNVEEITISNYGNVTIPAKLLATTTGGGVSYRNVYISLIKGHDISDPLNADKYKTVTYNSSIGEVLSNFEEVEPGDYTIFVYSEIMVYSAQGYTIYAFVSIGTDTNTTVTVVNPNRYQDWSEMLVKDTLHVNRLQSPKWEIGSYTKKNYLKYSNSDDDSGDFDYTTDYLTVNNAALDDESDLVSLQFSAPYTKYYSDRTVEYPLYTVTTEDSEVKYEFNGDSYSDIIAKIVINSTSGNYELMFPLTMRWSQIKADNYVEYQKLILKPRYSKENFRLSPEYLVGWNPEIPIYLKQYGKYYAVLTMQVDDSLNAEVELLEIKDI